MKNLKSGEIRTEYRKVLKIPFNTLLSVFGGNLLKIPYSEYGKSDYLLEVDFGELGVVHLYDYKIGKNYLGEDGVDAPDIKEWHLATELPEAVEAFEEFLLSVLSESEKKEVSF